MKIVHDSMLSPQYLQAYQDETYFRLFHDLHHIAPAACKGYQLVTATERDFGTIAWIINQSYTDLQVSQPTVEEWTQTPAYNKDLWVMVSDKSTGMCVGCGIADYDSEAREMALEWIQVLPAERNKKIGQCIVNELLNRAKLYAKFATVSGKTDNHTNPERLYRKSGFTGNDIWHVMRE